MQRAGRRKTLYSLARLGLIEHLDRPVLTREGREKVEAIRFLLREGQPDIVRV